MRNAGGLGQHAALLQRVDITPSPVPALPTVKIRELEQDSSAIVAAA